MCSISLNVTGFDTDNIIQQMMALEQQPLVKLQSQQQLLAQKKNAWEGLRTKLSTVFGSLTSLLSSSVFSSKLATSTQSASVTATASTSAMDGEYEVKVLTLATSHVVKSVLALDSADAQLGKEGTITIGGHQIAIGSEDSLQSIAAKINSLQEGDVRASVLETEPSVHHLVLTAKETGTKNAIAIQDLDDILGWEEVRGPRDSQFTIDGVTFTRSGNSVSDAISGVTLTLLQAGAPEAAGSIITVTNNDQAIVDSVKKFVSEYNAFMDAVKPHNTYVADTKSAGILFGEPLLQRLVSTVREHVFGHFSRGDPGFESISSIGISTGVAGTYSKEGRLTLDEAKLKEALVSNRDSVAALFGASTRNVGAPSIGADAIVFTSGDPPEPGVSADFLLGGPGGWGEDTSGDTVQVNFGESRTIDKLVLRLGAAPLEGQEEEPAAYQISYLDSKTQTWIELDASVPGNAAGYISKAFGAVEADAIRIHVIDPEGEQLSRIQGVEVYEDNQGVFNRLKDTIGSFTSADGFLSGRSQEIGRVDKDLTRQIESMQKRLNVKLESLKKKFSALEVLLQQFNSQSAWLTQQLNAFANY